MSGKVRENLKDPLHRQGGQFNLLILRSEVEKLIDEIPGHDFGRMNSLQQKILKV